MCFCGLVANSRVFGSITILVQLGLKESVAFHGDLIIPHSCQKREAESGCQDFNCPSLCNLAKCCACILTDSSCTSPRANKKFNSPFSFTSLFALISYRALFRISCLLFWLGRLDNGLDARMKLLYSAKALLGTIPFRMEPWTKDRGHWNICYVTLCYVTLTFLSPQIFHPLARRSTGLQGAWQWPHCRT